MSGLILPAPEPSEDELLAFLTSLPDLDEAGVAARVAGAGDRPSELPVRLIDLDGEDTEDAVRARCTAGREAGVAAVRVPVALAAVAVEALHGSPVPVAVTAVSVADVGAAADAEADEVEVSLDGEAFAAGRYAETDAALRSLKEAAGRAHLVVSLGAPGSLSDLRRAAWLALLAGAEMVALHSPDPAAVLVLLDAAHEFTAAAGRIVGVKVHAAGGLLTLVPADWRTPTRFRVVTSSLAQP